MSLLGPTPQRLAKAVACDTPITDTTKRRHAFRLVGAIELMHRDGRLRDEQLAAFQKFERDLTTAQKSSVLLSRYGDRASGGGTPISQLANDLLCPEERRADAFRRVSDAAIFVGEALTVETLILLATTDSSLQDVGRVVLLIGNKAQAISAAARTVQMGTHSLAMHYGMVGPLARDGPT